MKGEIPSITDLATITALTAVESKIPNVSNLVKKKQLSITQKLVNFKIKITTGHDHEYKRQIK